MRFTKEEVKQITEMLKNRCPECNSTNQIGALFCSNCGCILLENNSVMNEGKK